LPRVLAFLFPHSRVRHGDLEDYLVSIDVVEALTGLDFFNEFGEEVQRALEDTDTFENWDGF
jgi:endonuclease G